MGRPKSTHPVFAGMGGRKPLPAGQRRDRRTLYLTDAEWEKVGAFAAGVIASRPPGVPKLSKPSLPEPSPPNK